ncbi:MAG: UxaA family hydrolase [Dethiobacter sp.]|jgi:altronate dehydratase large subunit|nr:UxaA family hydrolase [Dethiobacter sp.]
MKFLGYLRADGNVGVRNHLLVIPSVICANNTAQRIAQQLPGAVYITHEHGCGSHVPSDKAQTYRTLVGFAGNPNVGACIVVGLGCEGMKAESIAADIAKTGKPVECIVIQKVGGTIKAVSQGVTVGRQMLGQISSQRRQEFDLSKLILALECGGSDTTSGIAANPAVGVASDLLVQAGGTSILSETTELVGAEHLLARRAINKEVADRILQVVHRAESKGHKQGVDMTNLAPGNRDGGLSTVEEKSLGCCYKAGSSPVSEVVEYAFRPSRTGLVIMDTPGYDVESITGMVAGGAQVVVFTTGRGTPVGCPIAPVIKVCGNSSTYEKMQDNIDINAGVIIDGISSVQDVGRDMFREIIEVSNGKLTKAEQLGFGDFSITRIFEADYC